MKIEGCIIQKKKIIVYSNHDFQAWYKHRFIYVSDDHGYGQPKSKDPRRYHVEVFGMDGIHDVNDTKDFPTIEDAMENALQAACRIVKERMENE